MIDGSARGHGLPARARPAAGWKPAATTALLAVAFLLAPPLLWAASHALDPASLPSPAALGRIAVLTRNTAALAAGTLLLALPVGVLLAFLLSRTDLPGRSFTYALLLVPLVIPLPLWASGWLLAAGAATLDPLALASRAMPWTPGLGPAVAMHALAALPWVVLIVGRGLRAVEPELEEDAALSRPGWWVAWRVTLPRARRTLFAAALWVVVQTATEVLITDLFQVRTFAEEVYTQNVAPEPDGAGDPIGRAVLTSLGFVAAVVALVGWWAAYDEPPLAGVRPPLVFRLGRGRWPLGLLVFGAALALAGVPLGSLVRRAGGVEALRLAWRSAGLTLAANLLVAASVGLFTATLALLAAWLVRGPARSALIVLTAAAWALPGPVVGLAMKGLWKAALDATGYPPWLAGPLWYGPSYLPVAWVAAVRLFPFALAVVDPAVRGIPRELFDAARLDGVGRWAELTRLVLPLTGRAWAGAAWAVAVLALGELSAARVVSTPGAETYAEMVFSQLHYGVGADLAAKCLLMASAVLLTTPLALLLRR